MKREKECRKMRKKNIGEAGSGRKR